MRTPVVLIVAVICLLNSQFSKLFGQGTAFTYQGRLNDGGAPATGIYDLRFTLYDALSNGGIIGSITNSPTGVSNGLFAVTLDFGNIFTGSNYWVEIAARTNGGGAFSALSPRQAITPTPYALYSARAGTANAFSGSLTGDVTGTQGATVVSSVGGQSADYVSSGVFAANSATSGATANAIVKRDGLGSFTAGPIFVTSVNGNGAALTSLNASELTSGQVPNSRLSTNVPLLSANQTFTGSNFFVANDPDQSRQHFRRERRRFDAPEPSQPQRGNCGYRHQRQRLDRDCRKFSHHSQ